MQKPQGGGKRLVQILEGALGGGGGGGIVMDEIDTCVRSFMSELNKSFHDRSFLRPISSCWKLEWRCNDLLSWQ